MRAFESIAQISAGQLAKAWSLPLLCAAVMASTGVATAQTVLPIAAPIAASSVDETFRILITTEHADQTGRLLNASPHESADLSAVAGQIEFHPFRDEFYLAAGALQTLDNSQPEWARIAQESYITPLPTTHLTEADTTGELQELVRYLGAGIRVHSINDWSLTVEGGAYFSDSAEDRLQMFDPSTGRMIILQDDLDEMDPELVGARDTSSVKPVGHLVVRRRF